VCDINESALDWFDEIDTVTTKVTDYRDLLSDASIDVIYVAVRHDLHERIYSDVIAAGKSLLAEKPFGIDQSAAEAILAAVEKHPESFVRCSSEMPFFSWRPNGDQLCFERGSGNNCRGSEQLPPRQ